MAATATGRGASTSTANGGTWVSISAAARLLEVSRSTFVHWITTELVRPEAVKRHGPRNVLVNLELAREATADRRRDGYHHSEETKRKIGAAQPNRRHEGEMRPCEYCGVERWVSGSDLAAGKGRFHKSCRMRWLREHEPDRWVRDLGPLRSAALDQLDEPLAPGELSAANVAERVGVSEETVSVWICHGTKAAGQLEAKQRARPGRRPMWVVDEDELLRFVRANARDGDGRFKRWEDEQFVEDLRETRGLSRSRGRTRRRREIFRARRSSGAPRKAELHAAWRRLFHEIRERLSDGWSDWEVCSSVADEHIRLEPGAWRKYTPASDGGLLPEDVRRATARVWMAIR